VPPASTFRESPRREKFTAAAAAQQNRARAAAQQCALLLQAQRTYTNRLRRQPIRLFARKMAKQVSDALGLTAPPRKLRNAARRQLCRDVSSRSASQLSQDCRTRFYWPLSGRPPDSSACCSGNSYPIGNIGLSEPALRYRSSAIGNAAIDTAWNAAMRHRISSGVSENKAVTQVSTPLAL
jgi:hypothetical protein